MNAPIHIPPMAGETVATITSYPELIEAFRIVKARLGLSNKWVDGTCDFADGVTDKLLGPSQSKSIGPLAFSMLCQVFAVKFRMEIDLDAVRKMESFWEMREEGKVAVPETRISKKLVGRAKPHVLRANAALGGLKRAALLTSKQRCRIAKNAARKSPRLNGLTPQRRSEIARKAGLASAAKRRAAILAIAAADTDCKSDSMPEAS